jgi:putative ABC transport system ATP-binding protein
MSLSLNMVGKSFIQENGRLNILKSLSLDVNPGEILAIVGESGSGKSTLLSLIAGFEKPDEGQIAWQKQSTLDWDDLTWAEFRKKNLGFVFQSYQLIPYLTAIENVALPLRLLRKPDAMIQAGQWLQRFNLAGRGSHLPSQLSGGERQRVAIARALIHQPTLVLADEPTGSLDVKTGAQVLEVLFSTLQQAHQTTLLVTHSEEVAARCDRILTLQQGRLWSK